MTKADTYLYNDINHILHNGFIDQNPRPHYADGKPAHTISVNHVMRSYDLDKGEFPICTLRPQAWKTGPVNYLQFIKINQTKYQNSRDLVANGGKIGHFLIIQLDVATHII